MNSNIGELDLIEDEVVVNNVRLTFFRSKQLVSQTPTVLFVHGVACHARNWDSIIRRLDTTLPIVSVELRGHGRSQKKGPYGWGQFGSDLCALVQTLGLSSVVGVGHSMGGHLLLQAASVLAKKFKALLLFEPAVFAPATYISSQQVKLFDSPSEHPFARRRAIWQSPEAWFEKIKNRTPFNVWTEEALHDHCQYGLEPTSDGQFQLRCPPIVEAEASLACADTSVHSLLSAIAIPVKIFRAKTAAGFRHPMDNIHSVTWPALSGSLSQGMDIHLTDLSHFIPMQRPELVASELTEILGETA
ncbi:MAG: alpha/beta hydrolase [Gammaproteobacteria bacterium]|nr:alpha/beta hydrolase [Gammaproteobacteria bacterium]